MADGPTVKEILETRETEIRGCEQSRLQERLKIIKGPRTAVDIATGLVNFDSGLGRDQNIALQNADSNKELCVFKARLKADGAMAVREASLEAESRVLRGTIAGMEAATGFKLTPPAKPQK